MPTKTADLQYVAQAYRERLAALERRIIICAGTGCVAGGSLRVYQAFADGVANAKLNAVVDLRAETPKEKGVYISRSGCQGFCQMGPLVTILPEKILYTKVKVEDVPEIIEKTLQQNQLVDRLLYVDPRTKQHCKGTDEIPFYTKQFRFVLKECGLIDPEDIQEYLSKGGYQAARRACLEQTPEFICAEMTQAGLRGRGGAGFPTGKKWEMTRRQPGDKKYIICNGDEGDPGAFMDRSVMEGNPHSVIEGMIIASRAFGADEGVVYVRAEYPLAVRRMRRAVQDAAAMGILGESIFGSPHSVTISVMEGAGAFVCGEETALVASVEGRRGMPAPKPPFPAQSGLNGRPTAINNVETLATVPLIMAMGAAEFRKIGMPNSPGTKTFALTGHVANTGLIEVPMGATLRQVVNEIAGGVTDDNGRVTDDGFKAVQIGGPSGGCLTPEHLDVPLDFDSLRKVGAMVGSGGLVVMNQSTCMVNIARFFMQFTQNESCGKCVLCREGTKQMLSLLDEVTTGQAGAGTLDLLEKLAQTVQKGSLCGLGKTAPNPVLSTLRHFRGEYEAHVKNHACPTGRCKALVRFRIVEELCKGCSLCARKCPVGAIHGEKAQPFRIDQEVCIRCGACVETCKFKAITTGEAA